MATKGKLEGRISVPTGGWQGTVGGNVFVLPAGEYFLSSAATSGSSLIAGLQSVMDAAVAQTITVALSASETGTGKVTITSSGSVAVAWTSTDLRDLLGFAGDLASGTSWTGDNQARGLWLPDCAYKAPNSAMWRGWPESDFMATEMPSGHVAAFMGESRIELELAWRAVTRPCTWIAHETTGNASWERFARDCIWATTSSWGTPGGPIRFYPDASTNSVFGTYTVPGARSVNPQPVQDGWPQGPWMVELPKLLIHPSYAEYGD